MSEKVKPGGAWVEYDQTFVSSDNSGQNISKKVTESSKIGEVMEKCQILDTF